MLSGDIIGPGADATIAKVATLSEHAFEAPRKGSDLNPILTAAGATGRSTPVAGFGVISSVSTSSRPDRVAYDVEQKRIETRIGWLHEMLVRCVSHPDLLTAVIPNNTQAAVNDDISNMALVNESFQADSDAIDAEHAAEDLRKRLDDPKAKAVSEHYHGLEDEMNVTKGKADLFGNPSLFELQRRLKRQINTLFSERYDLISRLDNGDTRYSMPHGRAEWLSAERKVELSEDQHLPVKTEDQIEDCQTLIEFFSAISTAAMVDFVPLVKTGEEEEDYFVGTKDKEELDRETGELLFPPASDRPLKRTGRPCERCRAYSVRVSIVSPPVSPNPPRVRFLTNRRLCRHSVFRRLSNMPTVSQPRAGMQICRQAPHTQTQQAGAPTPLSAR